MMSVCLRAFVEGCTILSCVRWYCVHDSVRVHMCTEEPHGMLNGFEEGDKWVSSTICSDSHSCGNRLIHFAPFDVRLGRV